MTWITNPGTDEIRPDPYLDYDTQLRVRFVGTRHNHPDTFDDFGEVGEFYWLHDGEPSDIAEYQLIKESE